MIIVLCVERAAPRWREEDAPRYSVGVPIQTMGRGRMMRGKLYDTITARTMHVNKRVRRMDVFLEARNGRNGLINLTF